MSIEHRRWLLRDEIVAAADHVSFWWFIARAPQELGCGHVVEGGERFTEIDFGPAPAPVHAVSLCRSCWRQLEASLPRPEP